MPINSLPALRKHIYSGGNIKLGADKNIHRTSAAVTWFQQRRLEMSWQMQAQISVKRTHLQAAVLKLVHLEHPDFAFRPLDRQPRSERKFVRALLDQVSAAYPAGASGSPKTEEKSLSAAEELPGCSGIGQSTPEVPVAVLVDLGEGTSQ